MKLAKLKCHLKTESTEKPQTFFKKKKKEYLKQKKLLRNFRCRMKNPIYWPN